MKQILRESIPDGVVRNFLMQIFRMQSEKMVIWCWLIMVDSERVVLQSRQISQYFSPSATPKEMETSILSMLDTAKEWRSYFPEDSTLDDVNRRMRKVLEGMKRTKSRAPER